VTASSSADLQQAILFLSRLPAGTDDRDSLPGTVNYAALARRARASGLDVSPGALEQAFRLIMRARLLASGKSASATAPSAPAASPGRGSASGCGASGD
jgi:hypothetical protein